MAYIMFVQNGGFKYTVVKFLTILELQAKKSRGSIIYTVTTIGAAKSVARKWAQNLPVN